MNFQRMRIPLCSASQDLVPRNEVKWNGLVMDRTTRDHELLYFF